MIDPIAEEKNGYFPRSVTENQSKDTGMAIVLICLLISYFTENNFISLAILLLLQVI